MNNIILYSYYTGIYQLPQIALMQISDFRKNFELQQYLEAIKQIFLKQFQYLAEKIRFSIFKTHLHCFFRFFVKRCADFIHQLYNTINDFVVNQSQHPEQFPKWHFEKEKFDINNSEPIILKNHCFSDEIRPQLMQTLCDSQIMKSITQKPQNVDIFIQEDIEGSDEDKFEVAQHLNNQQKESVFKKMKKVSQISIKKEDQKSLTQFQKKEKILKQTRRQYLKQILQLKLLVKSNFLNLFNSEKQKMWFLQKNQQMIATHLETIDQKYTDYMIKQLRQLRGQLQQRMFKYDQTCKKHLKKVFYVCWNEYLPQKVYLCQECMLEVQKGSCHINHEIGCKEHRLPITMGIQLYTHWNVQYESLKQQQSEQLPQQFQYFLCSFDNKRSNVKLITSCHYAVITEICLEPECIMQDNFKICPLCPNYHINHRTILFTKQNLFNQFKIESKDDITSYQNFYLNLRQKLRLQTVKKIVDASVNKMWHFAKFIEAFAVHGNEQMEMWSHIVLEKGYKEDMFVLWAVGELKRRDFGGKEKQNFLEIINDRLQEEVECLLDQVASQLQRFRVRIEKLMSIKENEIEDYLNNKYREVTEGKVQQSMTLREISQQNLGRIVKLEIYKEDESQYQIKIAEKRQAMIRKFYNRDYEEICRREEISHEDQRNIRIILNRKQRIKQHEISRFSDVVRKMQSSLKEIQRLFEVQSTTSPAISLLLSHKLVNLQNLHIRYSKEHGGSQTQFSSQIRRQDYCVSAFHLFRLIHNITTLKEIQIIGIKVEYMDQFIRKFFITKKQMISIIHSEQTEWIRDFNPNQALDLHINCILQFDITNTEDVHQKSSYLSFFASFFKSLGQITVNIIVGFSPQFDRNIHMLRNCLMPLHKLKINIKGCPMLANKNSQTLMKIFDFLAQFTTITQLEFQYIFLDPYADQYHTSVMQSSLVMISYRNSITHLLLHRCNGFPLLPRFETLKYLYLKDVSFRKPGHTLRNLIMMNPSLKVFRNEWISASEIDQIDLSRLTQLQSLHILYSGWLDYGSLRTLPGYSIKHLAIGNHYENSNIGSDYLEEVFSRLQSLQTLQLYLIDFSGKNLLCIPSPNLSELHLWQNRYVTNEDIWALDCKWPYLNKLKILGCARVDGRIFGKCKFRGLVQLGINEMLLKESDSVLEYLCKRGIKVNIY